MKEDEIESLLTGTEETDTLEFKNATSWDRNLFVKDILAMSNTMEGGTIVAGVEDGTLTRVGVTDTQIQTYDIETMRDQIAPFADPRVNFRRKCVVDVRGLQYIIIEVSPFTDVPVICKRDGADVKAGVIYFRSRTRRPESAPINNSSDMRDLVERSAALSARRLEKIGFVVPSFPDFDYDSELGGL